MSVQYPDLTDYLAVAAAVTGLDTQTLVAATKLHLADSALHAPSAGFGEQDLYPDFVSKAAVLLVRLAKNHPLLDGNKRAAWVTLRLFVDMNGWSWNPYPSIDEAEKVVLSVTRGSGTRNARLIG
ncbi:MAG: Fic family protein [Acidimicrobiales bacterium]